MKKASALLIILFLFSCAPSKIVPIKGKYPPTPIVANSPKTFDQAWDIIFDTVHSYVDSIDQQHRSLPPGDSSVVASHAGLSVMSQFETFFKEDLESAMDFAAHPDEEFTKYLHGFRDRLDVLKQQEE